MANEKSAPQSARKAGKFIELGNKRVNKAIKELRLVANLANRSNYVYTDEQAVKIVKALQKEVDVVKSRFKKGGGDSAEEFSL